MKEIFMYFAAGLICGMFIYLSTFLVFCKKFEKDETNQFSLVAFPIAFMLFLGVAFALVKAIKMLGLC
jgi:hypothetical protein